MLNFSLKVYNNHYVENYFQGNELELRKGLRSLKCETCQRSFHNDEQIRSHVCKHHACDLCDMKFLKYKNLKCHKLIHEGQTVFSCDQCEALFQNRCVLSQFYQHFLYEQKQLGIRLGIKYCFFYLIGAD